MTLARKTSVPTSVMKQRTTSGLRALAGKIDNELPGMVAPHHLRDAARALESGNHEGAKRHLQSAMHTMAPVSLMRHGVLDDDGHSRAKVNMDLINRHYLLVRDLEDAHAHNEALRATPGTFTQPGHLPLGRSMEQPQIRGAASADGGPGAPKSVRAAMVPAPAQNTGIDRNVAGGPKAPSRLYNQLPARPMPQAVLSWADIDRLIELSAQTPRLASTPAPYGKPGGPGLYGVKGNKHSDYFEQVVKALMEKRGMDKGKASAVAWGALRRWSKGRGHVHPEVRAAAGGALVQEKSAATRAHAHANTSAAWTALDMAIDLSALAAGGSSGPPPAAPAPAGGGGSASVQPRVPPGSPQGGQFGSASSGSSNKNKAAAPSNSANAQRKALMLKQAAQDRAQAALLMKQLASLTAASKATTAKTLAATKAGATGKSASSTPAKTTSAAPAVPAAPGKSAAAKPGAAASGKKPTRAQLVYTLKTQIAALLTQANMLTAQAAKL